MTPSPLNLEIDNRLLSHAPLTPYHLRGLIQAAPQGVVIHVCPDDYIPALKFVELDNDRAYFQGIRIMVTCQGPPGLIRIYDHEDKVLGYRALYRKAVPPATYLNPGGPPIATKGEPSGIKSLLRIKGIEQDVFVAIGETAEVFALGEPRLPLEDVEWLFPLIHGYVEGYVEGPIKWTNPKGPSTGWGPWVRAGCRRTTVWDILTSD